MPNAWLAKYPMSLIRLAHTIKRKMRFNKNHTPGFQNVLSTNMSSCQFTSPAFSVPPGKRSMMSKAKEPARIICGDG